MWTTRIALPASLICAVLTVAPVNAQISIQTNSDGTSSVSLAGQMSVPEGMDKIFTDIDNTLFSCSVVAPVKSFFQRVKGKATLAAMVSDKGAISIDHEEGLPIEAIIGGVVFVPAKCTFKADVPAAADRTVGKFRVHTTRAFKAGERVVVLYGTQKTAALMSRTSGGGSGPAFAAYADGSVGASFLAGWRAVVGSR